MHLRACDTGHARSCRTPRARWLAFFHYLRHHPELLDERVMASFFSKEHVRAWAGIVSYLAGGATGYVNPTLALVVFLALPVFYGVTSHGLDELADALPFRRRPPAPVARDPRPE
jgi:hypothetical protein